MPTQMVSNRECILYLTLSLILSVNKANESALTAQNLAWAGLADTCRHLLNSADLHSLLVDKFKEAVTGGMGETPPPPAPVAPEGEAVVGREPSPAIAAVELLETAPDCKLR